LTHIILTLRTRLFQTVNPSTYALGPLMMNLMRKQYPLLRSHLA
jgi:hypothetical protein